LAKKPPVSIKQIDGYLPPFGSLLFSLFLSLKPTMGAPFTAIRLSLFCFFNATRGYFPYLFFIFISLCVMSFTHSHTSEKGICSSSNRVTSSRHFGFVFTNVFLNTSGRNVYARSSDYQKQYLENYLLVAGLETFC
jgi:hypothetical protein